MRAHNEYHLEVMIKYKTTGKKILTLEMTVIILIISMYIKY